MSAASVLVVDDNPDILAMVSILLERAGHRVIRAGDGRAALKAVFDRRPDLIVLDIGMPGLDGWAVLERVREVSDVPVLMLTAESDELDKVRGLRGGADDFVTKPFGRQELVARVEALLRRNRRAPEQELDVSTVGGLTVDHVQRVASIDGRELRLTPIEFRLLAAFARNPGQVLSASQIIESVWGDSHVAPDQVKLVVGRLRRKIAEHVDPPPIETVRGFGYRYLA